MIIKTQIFLEAEDAVDVEGMEADYFRSSLSADDAIAFVGAMERKLEAERILTNPEDTKIPF